MTNRFRRGLAARIVKSIERGNCSDALIEFSFIDERHEWHESHGWQPNYAPNRGFPLCCTHVYEGTSSFSLHDPTLHLLPRHAVLDIGRQAAPL